MQEAWRFRLLSKVMSLEVKIVMNDSGLATGATALVENGHDAHVRESPGNNEALRHVADAFWQ